MATITTINTPAKSPRKRAIYLDGKWAFNVTAVVAAKHALEVGQDLTPAMIEAIQSGEVQQKALDKGLAILSRRLHSRSELRGKLLRAKYTEPQTEHALDELTRLGYVDDARFAKTKAHAAAEYRKHGRRRAYMELIKAGVEKETARRASEDVFDAHDSLKVARELAARKLPSLRKLDPQTARRRLLGMLVRRGFTFDEVRPVMDEVLGVHAAEEAARVNRATGEVIVPGEETAATPDRDPSPAKRAARASATVADETAATTEDAAATEPGNWRTGVLSHHHRRNEKPAGKWGKPGKWRRR